MGAETKQQMKVTLTNGKEVVLREYRIRHREMAIRAVGNKAGENNFLFGELLQKEMIKILLASVGGKAVSPVEIEDLDSLFSATEYNELSQVIGKVMGGNSQAGEPKIEFVNTGI